VIILVFSITLIAMLNSNIANILYSNNNSNTSLVTTNVLIYDGDGVMESSVEDIEECLNTSNYENLTPNNKFEYSTTSEINSNTLSGYDVLIMPGGNSLTYLENDDIDGNSIKLFVQRGKGYLGICAGAYAASNYVDGYYQGWGITPDVNTKNENYEGSLKISTTSAGSKLINGSITNIHMQNGPAMYTNNTQVIMATFADNNTGYQNYAAIVADTFGSGRVILSGPHPETEPQNPQLLTNMLQWISKRI
jgi:glutamine amidotransferase-like uncharacterized protein